MYLNTIYRARHTPAQAKVFQPRKLSREEQQELLQSFPLERRQSLLPAQSSLGEASDSLGKYSYALSQYLYGKGSHPHNHLPTSLLFIVREGDEEVRAGLEKNEYGLWEMKEEGRRPSKFLFLPPASPNHMILGAG